MENTEGSINVFISGVLPKEKYSDVNELARDIASVLRIDQDRIVVDLIALESLKGEQGEQGSRGVQGTKGDKGDKGEAGAAGGLTPFTSLTISGLVATWTLNEGTLFHSAALTLPDGTGTITLNIVGATSGMRGTLKLTQNAAGAAHIGLPPGSKVPGAGFDISHTAGSIDILQWIYDGAVFLWTIDNNFITLV